MAAIFDFHTHAYPDKVAEKAVDFLNNYYHFVCQGTGFMADLLASAREGGVDYLLLHAVATRPDQVVNANNWLAAQLSDRVFGFATIHPKYDDIAGELARIRQLGFKGIKFHPDFQEFAVNDPSLDAIYANIEGDLPVLVHAGDEVSDFSSPERIADVMARYPRLTLIAAHLGGYSAWLDAKKFLIGKNLYIDTSSALWAMSPEIARDLIRSHGVEKVLFGTDYPVSHHKEELRRFYRLGLEEWENKLILFENAKKLLKLNID